jgi:hypothetical protein
MEQQETHPEEPAETTRPAEGSTAGTEEAGAAEQAGVGGGEEAVADEQEGGDEEGSE